MFEKLKRPYKDRSAAETIEKIKNILDTLHLKPFVMFNANPYPEVYSVRLELDEEEGGFGTNGKGRSEEYAFASCYAEFLERIQNGFYAHFSRTMQQEILNSCGFNYYPDEKIMTKEEISSLPENILEDIIIQRGEDRIRYIDEYFARLYENGRAGVVGVPFYDTMNETTIHLPLNMLVLALGSNGMAAGNTLSEAIFQGICEIMERWSGAEIFYGMLTPPKISDAILKEYQKEFEIIQEIEKSGIYSVKVMDFSANKKIASVGILIVNKDTNKYRLNIGSDTCFQVALSRCITEIYQGVHNPEDFDRLSLDVPQELDEMFTSDTYEAFVKREEEYAEFVHDGSGTFPITLFGETPSYSVDMDAFITYSSHDEEVRELITRFHKEGHNVYIRDVSFLGFPSVMVYIPHLSAMGKKNVPSKAEAVSFNIVAHDRIEPLYFKLRELDDNQREEVAFVLERFGTKLKLEEAFHTELKRKSPWKDMKSGFMLALLWYSLGNIDKTLWYLEDFIDQENPESLYYTVVRSYLQNKKLEMEEFEILEKLTSEGHESSLISEVMNDMRNPHEILNNIKLPSCPNCNSCELADDCLTRIQVVINKRLLNAFSRTSIKQDDLQKIFSSSCIEKV